MANTAKHAAQVSHNELCYAYLTQAGSYSDWETTILFYRALHMVDQYLAKYSLGHPKSHRERYDFIKMYLNDIREEYSHLYAASRKSRYDTDYLSEADKGKSYHDRLFKDNFIPFSQKMARRLSTSGP